MKRILIISPHFPPVNAADMQRVRMSLPYFSSLGWEAEVITVDEKYVDSVKDQLLLQSVPEHIQVHKVKALSKRWTSKLGLGSLALRSLWFFRKKGNQLLRKKKFDLIYFSTTEFPVCILGNYWKKKFGIPYIIDMQDPWHSDYYKDKPKSERPKKYWFAYRMHKYLEPMAMQNVDGIVSVSDAYIQTLKERYVQLLTKPTAVITFGAFDIDFEIAEKNNDNLKLVFQNTIAKTNLVYIGRGGYDMKPALDTLFKVFKHGLASHPHLFAQLHLHFIGTSYAPKGKGIPTIAPIAATFDLSAYVTEYTDRIGFYQSIKNMQKADGLIIIGSNQAAYTASKLYPYILAKKNLLAILHPESSATSIMEICNAGYLLAIDEPMETAVQTMVSYLESIYDHILPSTNWDIFESYTAVHMAKRQVQLFNKVIQNYAVPL